MMMIDNAVEQYVADFDNHRKDERYKWQAVQWFQDNWNPDVTDFAEMVENATSKTLSLLTSMNAYPRGMLINFAKVVPDDARQMFANLSDESIDLAKRVQQFIDMSEVLRSKHIPGSWKCIINILIRSVHTYGYVILRNITSTNTANIVKWFANSDCTILSRKVK